MRRPLDFGDVGRRRLLRLRRDPDGSADGVPLDRPFVLWHSTQAIAVSGEVAVRPLAMTAALVIVGVSLQFVLYAQPLRLCWFTV